MNLFLLPSMIAKQLKDMRNQFNKRSQQNLIFFSSFSIDSWCLIYPYFLQYKAIIVRPLLRTFARKFSNIDFFLRLLPLKVDELLMSEM